VAEELVAGNYYEEYEYDSKGNQTKASFYIEGELTGYYEYEYDSKGNRTKDSRYSAAGELSYYTVYTYKTIVIG
jgi:hypothetical protein